ncbi:MAG: tetratricopeptide repeat protein [Casimicrobiaceae bacterium]
MEASAGAVAVVGARLAAGDAEGARTLATTTLATPALDTASRVALLVLRARAHGSLREARSAVVDLEAALALQPGDARVANELGIACVDAADPQAALEAFRRATTIDPAFARAWNNYGNALRTAGRTGAAIEAFARAVSADGAYALAWANLGTLQRESGDTVAAETALSRALEIEPQQRVAVLALAGLRREQGRIDDAAALYARGADLDPRDANALLLRGGALAERDDLAGARDAFAGALRRDPGLLRAALARELTLPMAPASRDEIDATRNAYAGGLARLASELPARAGALDAARTLDELRWSNFLLAYQGEDDRALQAAHANNVRAVLGARAAQWLEPVPRRSAAGRRLRVGFLSAFFRDGTAGRYFERWITDLPRERFEVVVYHLQPAIDPLAARLRARADAFNHCPRWRPSQLAPRVRADALDALVFPELGMDATTFGVAALRLAPRQCAAWGHPVTSGLPAIDVFFTCGEMEPSGAAAHYTETLWPLPGIGTRYAMPESLTHAPDRASVGLPADGTLFLCPQSLFKIHPDNDALFARVLAANPGSRLILFEGRHAALTAKLAARLAAACRGAGADAARIHFVPQRSHREYLALGAACDAMLDTVRWSGGNTTLDALACALPPVTLPGEFMRARQSAAMLRAAGVPELIARDADDYVSIATRIAVDRAARQEFAARLRAGRDGVFDDKAPVIAFAGALEEIAGG